MSTISKWFRSAAAQDFSYRQSQNRPLFHSGTNRNPLGTIPPANATVSSKAKRFIAGKSLAGGEEVAG